MTKTIVFFICLLFIHCKIYAQEDKSFFDNNTVKIIENSKEPIIKGFKADSLKPGKKLLKPAYDDKQNYLIDKENIDSFISIINSEYLITSELVTNSCIPSPSYEITFKKKKNIVSIILYSASCPQIQYSFKNIKKSEMLSAEAYKKIILLIKKV